ncbi:MAG TPA: hypothetical protein VGM91_07905 [Conexibacter sp.]|jgi:hypothetical protein
MRTKRTAKLAVAGMSLVAIALAGAAEGAQAATVTVTAEDGSAIPLAAGQSPRVRTLAPVLDIAQAPGAARYSAGVTDPTGSATAAAACEDPARATRITPAYRGNGTYTVSVTTFAPDDLACTAPPVAPPESYQFAIAGGVVVQRRSPFVLRTPGSARVAPLSLPILLAPGADRSEVRFRRGGTLRRDGSIRGRSNRGTVDSSTRTALVALPRPGDYTVVARALRGGIGTPWSVPVRVHAVAPFDFRRFAYVDKTGPSFALQAAIREPSARGVVTVALARGATGGRFATIQRVRISRAATFVARFTAIRAGTYRLRFSYPGSKTVARGTIVSKLHVGTAIVG